MVYILFWKYLWASNYVLLHTLHAENVVWKFKGTF